MGKNRGTLRWIDARLDRALLNTRWRSLLHSTRPFNLEHPVSDHIPLFLDPWFQCNLGRSRGFLFENAWLKDKNYIEIIQECWNYNKMFSIQEKLE